ncbi:MAG: site-2 protease family protein [Candidatus Nanoarchaeia archaeon]|nr:site-2 protease family protein [Candidatus Nanoarchaeia archaeon]
MDKLANKYPRFLKYLGYLSIFTGFAGMIFIFYILVKGTYKLIMIPNTTPLLAPVLPGVKVAGLPVLSFWHWIIAILFVAVVHEFSHGVYARLCNTKIKSSGFAFLGPILAAFVEPDEKQMAKKSKKDQLAVLSAGPFSNILSSIIILILTLLVINPIAYSFVSMNGVQVNSLEKDFPAELSGMKVGEEILSINNITIQNPNNFSDVLVNLKPKDEVFITTNVSSYKIIATERPDDKTKGYMGIVVSSIDVIPKEGKGNLLPMFMLWLAKLFFWLYAINLGVGLFNLLPLGPVDGGRMFSVGISYFIKDSKKVNKIFSLVSLFCLLLIFINLLPYLIKLVLFIVKPILVLLI